MSEKLKTLASFNYQKVQYFLLKFCTHFPLNNSKNGCSGFFSILFRSWVINKNVKNKCEEARPFLMFEITQDLNKI